MDHIRSLTTNRTAAARSTNRLDNVPSSSNGDWGLHPYSAPMWAKSIWPTWPTWPNWPA